MVSTLVLYYRRSNREAGGGKVTETPATEEGDSLAFPGGTLSVYFASQTGTAEGFSRIIAEEGRRHGFKTCVVDLEDFEEEQLRTTGKAIFLMSTYGEGEPPDNAIAFSAWLADEEGVLESSHLAGLEVAVFGLGNRQYDHYNQMGKRTDAGLEKLGTKRMYMYGEGDDDGSLEEDFEAWKEGLWPALAERFGQGGTQIDATLHSIPLKVVYLTQDEAVVATPVLEAEAASSTKFFWCSKDATIVVNRELRTLGVGMGSTRHIEISLEGTGIHYETADNLAVLPENDLGAVEDLCKQLGYDPDAIFSLEYKDGNKAIFPTPCTTRKAFQSYLDVMSIPRRSLLEQFVPYVSDEVEREMLRRLSSKDGRMEYHEMIEGAGKTLSEVIISDVPSLRLPLENFLHIVPHLHPRYYTISSSKVVHPTNVHLTVALLETEMSKGRVYRGICSSYLGKLVPHGGETGGKNSWNGKIQSGSQGQVCACKVFVRPSTFRLPEKSTTPIIMIGPGTGVAPMRALLQERAFRKRQGDPVGKNILYFGCRHRDQDYIYRDELEAYVLNGTLDSLRLAFSREEEQKVYVQHLLSEDAKVVWSLLNEGAYVYVCGGTSMGNDVHKELSSIMRLQGAMSDEEAKEYLHNLHVSGRYVQELWS
ncbi:unnamed protein product [Choristocarpus tenellus]